MPGGGPIESLRISISKPQLGTCSLVCRYWAKLCRPHMFRTLRLRSRDDLYRFVQFTDAPSLVTPSLADCVRFIKVKHTSHSTEPWLHLIRAVITARPNIFLNPGVKLYLKDDETGPSESKRSRRPLYTSLPRAVPGAMYLFYSIKLRNVRFEYVDDLLRLFRDCSSAAWIECSHAVFNQSPPSLSSMNIRPRSSEKLSSLPGHASARISHSGGPEFEIGLMLALALSCSRGFVLRLQESAANMRAIALAVAPVEYCGGGCTIDAGSQWMECGE